MDGQPLSLQKAGTVILRILLLIAGLTVHAWADSPGELVAQGDALDARNENQKALDVYLKASSAQPDDPEIFHRIAKQYAQVMVVTKNPEEKTRLAQTALWYALRAKELAPDHARVRLALAIVYGRIALLEPPAKQIEMSRLIKQEADAAVELDPNYGLAWHVLGRWNYELASLHPLLKTLAQSLFGKFPDASYAAAANCLEKAVKLEPKRLANHAELGRCYLALGRKEEARRELEKALSMPPVEKYDAETQARAKKALETL